ncbi:zinc-binding dehydrogenase [Brucella sp. NBRC 12950]|uniref:zinc-binding dehydrogenase n=1 Tax=Brucella sp. NBRC 12950 TaxID=2994518 RepID=UPI0025542085|nr:zinc-binding dehydrogenase [Brucella sp. NBRC 12950]
MFAIKSAFLLGVGRVIAIDTVPERLELARISGADVLDYTDEDLQQKIVEMTDGAGPDAVIEGVGMESPGLGGALETM